jgi:[CysO sulfur-carrier protein]-S-L-cysteine hydrolase
VETQIEIPERIERRFENELRRGGMFEIGGILMGECLEPGRFRVVDFTVDHGGGTVMTFVRSLRGVLQALNRFFNQTAHDYCRFNYLGEWHSHPSFAPRPSRKDIESAQSIVDDPEVGANFVTLLIVKIGENGAIEGGATIFQANVPPIDATLVIEGRGDCAR